MKRRVVHSDISSDDVHEQAETMSKMSKTRRIEKSSNIFLTFLAKLEICYTKKELTATLQETFGISMKHKNPEQKDKTSNSKI